MRLRPLICTYDDRTPNVGPQYMHVQAAWRNLARKLTVNASCSPMLPLFHSPKGKMGAVSLLAAWNCARQSSIMAGKLQL